MERAKAMWRRLHLLAWLLALPVAADDPVWQSVSRGSVEVLTTADAVLARTALAELEALRAALASLAPGLARADAPLRIVLFDRESGAAEFRLNAFSPAYYAPGPAWSTIVVFGMDDRSLPSLRHEFIHHLVRAGGRRLPLWLEEGLADALSPLPQSEAQRRVKLLRSGRRIPWRELFEAKPAAALYQDWDSARLFYAQSWALTEALVRSAGDELGWEEIDAWQSAGQWTEEALDALLERFLRRPRPAGRKWKLERRPLEVRSDAAPAGLVWTVLGRLSLQLGDLEAAGARLRLASLVWPEALPWLGDLEYRRGRFTEARRAWRAAMAHGLADARTLLRLAVLEQDLPDGDMVAVLEKLLEVDPNQEEARLALVSQYIRSGR